MNVSPLMQALYERRQADVDAILATNPDLDVFEAAALGRTDRVSDLVAADPGLATALSPDGFTALHLAAFLGTTETARVLLASKSRQSLVLCAAAALCNGRNERGAPVNGQQQKGYTALDEAEMTNQDDLRDLLPEYGADPKVTGLT